MTMNPPKESLLDRFKRYARIDTKSDEDSESFPSTGCQWDLLRLLQKELVELGVTDASVDEYGYVFGTLSSNLPDDQRGKVPVVGFTAHADTSPAVSGTDVKPTVHPNYQGGDIALPGDPAQVIHASEYPNLENRYIGMDIVTSDGTTLLGADDKAGIAEIMTAIDVLIQNPDIEHGTIKVGFTPDEEVGRGADHFDVERFGADFAYTVDGGPLGEIEYESFNAYSATLTVEGFGVHPGYAKGKLINAIRIVSEFVVQLPKEMSPEMTEKREGYIHPYMIEGQNESVKLRILLRDFEMDNIDKQKSILSGIVAGLAKRHPKATLGIEFKESYRNMRYKVEEEPRLIEYAAEAIRRCGVEPNHQLIRGGTDGSRLSYMGLPCPNLFAGGEAIHSTIEWVPVEVMEKAAETIVHLASIWTERSTAK